MASRIGTVLFKLVSCLYQVVEYLRALKADGYFICILTGSRLTLHA